MKNLSYIFIFVLSLITSDLYSQVYDTIAEGLLVLPDTLNRIDTDNLKQGYWNVYDKDLQYSVHSDFGKNSGYKEYNYYTLSSEGSFVNSEKIGTWKYYRILNHKVIGVDKTVIYFENGSFIERNELKNYTLETNKDTTYLVGEYFLDNDTVLINCIENKCVFKLNDELIIDVFNKSEFEMKFYGLLIGVYNRKIRILKNE